MEREYERNTGLGLEGTSGERGRGRKGAKQAKDRGSFGAGFLLERNEWRSEKSENLTSPPFAQVSNTAGILPITSELLQVFLSSLGLLIPDFWADIFHHPMPRNLSVWPV